ncbi:MAG TPA: SIMPL domain-containing protein [Steroidobacteraceae bacterium]|nr:SIMPL domain-containing protein [Steroidobacteraceae bacterium]
MSRSALLMSGLVLAWLLPAAHARAEEPAPRVLSVSGEGEVRAQPDRAIVTLGIVSREPTLEAARAGANRVMAALLKLTRDLGIAEQLVHSTRLSVNPEYTRNEPKRENRLVGYAVRRQLLVELRDLDRLGELLEKGITAGANVVGDPLLDSGQRHDLEREALARAVADARQNAAVVAKALDASVGAPRSVATTATRSPSLVPVRRMAMAAAAAAEAPETYQSGELTFSASVNAIFDLVPGPTPR